nr:MAG TPA: hypothetical protein [Caudoviricetes sp.]
MNSVSVIGIILGIVSTPFCYLLHQDCVLFLLEM